MGYTISLGDSYTQIIYSRRPTGALQNPRLYRIFNWVTHIICVKSRADLRTKNFTHFCLQLAHRRSQFARTCKSLLNSGKARPRKTESRWPNSSLQLSKVKVEDEQRTSVALTSNIKIYIHHITWSWARCFYVYCLVQSLQNQTNLLTYLKIIKARS